MTGLYLKRNLSSRGSNVFRGTMAGVECRKQRLTMKSSSSSSLFSTSHPRPTKTSSSNDGATGTIMNREVSSTLTHEAQCVQSNSSNVTAEVPLPSPTQLRAHYISNGLPMVGFGLMDQTGKVIIHHQGIVLNVSHFILYYYLLLISSQTKPKVMIQAGNVIDCTLGVTFGLSTLSAAAVGGLISNVSGIIFGGTLESLAKAAGLPHSNLTAAQRNLPFVKRNRLLSQALGVFMGCCLGLLNLLFIDTERSSSLKLQQFTEDTEFAFEVEAHNDDPNATTLIIRGPDNDGLLAGMTAALSLNGCSILDVSAHKLPDGTIEDKFSIVRQGTGKRLEDEELVGVSKLLLEATHQSPLLLKAQMNEVEEQNRQLQERIKHLEGLLIKRRVTVRTSS
jgi:hypothetical protein